MKRSAPVCTPDPGVAECRPGPSSEERCRIGPGNLIIAFLIAATKAVLIVLFFMLVKFGDKLIWVFSGASFFRLGILLILLMSDDTSRMWLPIPGK